MKLIQPASEPTSLIRVSHASSFPFVNAEIVNILAQHEVAIEDIVTAADAREREVPYFVVVPHFLMGFQHQIAVGANIHNPSGHIERKQFGRFHFAIGPVELSQIASDGIVPNEQVVGGRFSFADVAIGRIPRLLIDSNRHEIVNLDLLGLHWLLINQAGLWQREGWIWSRKRFALIQARLLPYARGGKQNKQADDECEVFHAISFAG